ncbi:MAG: UTP-glucose-1-phosphate uridylyltransferase [Microgenomates bacterium 39_7]|nr:MAG: UTP-glucose-1-phosphate uridylyltransferase [Microgenomates bacterium 39_7]
MKTIKKAVISCAGFGTRFLPVSKTIQKEMLPLLNKPIIDYIVDDSIKAGIEEFVIVMNSHNYQPLHYFRENNRLEEYLKEMNKSHLYEEVKDLHQKAKFTFIKQTRNDPYGTSIPLLLSSKEIENEEAFLYLTGDDVIFFEDQRKSFVSELINTFQQSDADAALSCIEKSNEELHQYGVVKMKQKGNWNFLEFFVEKPSPDQAPSNLANISKYILTPSILPIIHSQKPNQSNNEFYITDAILELTKTEKVVINQTQGKYLNSGDPINWLKANLTVAGSDLEIREQLLDYIQNEWNVSFD